MAHKALGRFSPGAPPGKRQRDLLLAAMDIRRAAMRVFRAQRDWLRLNWMEIATEEQQRAIMAGPAFLSKQIGDAVPRRWEDWINPIAAELTKPIQRALGIGADSAQWELRTMVDWSIYSPEAVKWVEAHGLDLAKKMTNTTREQLRAVINQGIRDGASSQEIRDSLMSSLEGMTRRRAAMIAQTEVIGAQAEGALQVYRDAKVERKKWLDTRPRHCPVCARLDGQVVGIDEDFEDPETGLTYARPPSHPGCQCGIRGIVI